MSKILLSSLFLIHTAIINCQVLYNLDLSWEQNLTNLDALAADLALKHNYKRVQQDSQIDLFGYKLNSRIGLGACPLTTSSGIGAAALLGYDLITYKTVRSVRQDAYLAPNLHRLDVATQINQDNMQQKIVASNLPTSDNSYFALTNSFGINSADPQNTMIDIAKSRQKLLPGQVLIVSIYGAGATRSEQIQDFVRTAQIAVAGGAQILEANLSCPNVFDNQPIYQDPALVYEICQAICDQNLQVPLIVKLGTLTDLDLMREILINIARAKAKGVCGINSVPMQVTNCEGQPVFGADRKISGVSGALIFDLTQNFIKNCRAIIDQEKLDLKLLAIGGVVRWQDFASHLAAGADFVQCATGAMLNQELAKEYHENSNLIKKLFEIGAIKLQNIQIKTGAISPIYFDMRLVISHPQILNLLAQKLNQKLLNQKFDLICGVPYGAVPLATAVSMVGKYPMIMQRKETKAYGMGKLIEGAYLPDQTCVLIEDVVTSGGSILESILILEQHGLKVADILVLIDREQNGILNIQKKGYQVNALFTVTQVLQVLLAENLIDQLEFNRIKQFFAK
jgi:orotate phosphoribosyltransferase